MGKVEGQEIEKSCEIRSVAVSEEYGRLPLVKTLIERLEEDSDRM